MMTDHYFEVAGFLFKVSLSATRDIRRLLPSFGPFYQGTEMDADGREPLFNLSVGGTFATGADGERVLDVSENDMGHVRLLENKEGYIVELNFHSDGPVHVLQVDRSFRTARLRLLWEDPYAAEALSSMLRIVYSFAVPSHGGISVHAAAVVRGGMAYLFMGRSGTGKSTHAALWQRCFPGCVLLNDDNPTVRVSDRCVTVHGTPWSGKTPCYKNLGYPLGGVARLRQSVTNRFSLHTDVESFKLLLPGCSVMRSDRAMCGSLYDLLSEVAVRVKVGELECRPDEESARLCAASLSPDREQDRDISYSNN